MTRIATNGVELAVQVTGSGPPIVMVHGSLDTHRAWDRVVPLLADSYQVVTYDRRGHGASTCPPGQGRIGEDRDDLAGLISALGLTKPLVVGHSYGSATTLLLGARHPELTGGLLVHEPPLFALLRDDPATLPLAERAAEQLARAAALITSGAVEEGVRHFVNTAAFGPDTWENLFTPEIRETCVAHADTWLDQSRDPDRLSVRPELLASYPHRIGISHGDASPPAYAPVAELVAAAIPTARRHVVPGAGHAPHLSHPRAFADLIRAHAQGLHPTD
ncbi:alpha/beta fold hydrolase [Pseudonocardia acaciae]|uniref:alpha/beta fold hydrolase n=1 Tax=Pseudonocardia acaciae TaxID=551276 RepID=UPI0004905EB0|nr:alpha/beta hydrolase [Pseudonocardia acaciae]